MAEVGSATDIFAVAWNNGIWLLLAMVLGLFVGWTAGDSGGGHRRSNRS